MRRVALLLAALPVAAHAGSGLLGTKADVMPASTGSPVGIMPLVQMAVALAIVVGLVKWVLPKVLNRVGGGVRENGDIKVESTTSFGAGSLHIVRARNRTLLIGATSTGLTCLADLTEEELPPLSPMEAESPFSELLNTAVTRTPAPQPRPVNDVAMALERLRALED